MGAASGPVCRLHCEPFQARGSHPRRPDKQRAADRHLRSEALGAREQVEGRQAGVGSMVAATQLTFLPVRFADRSRVLGSEPLLTDNLPFISGVLTYQILSINT